MHQSYMTIQRRNHSPLHAWIMNTMEGTGSRAGQVILFGLIGALWAIISLSVM